MSRVSLLSRSFCHPIFHGTQRNFNPAYHEETRRPVEISMAAPDHPFQRSISPGGARCKFLGGQNWTLVHWFPEVFLYFTEFFPKAKRAGLSQREIRLFGYSFFSKSNQTAVNQIPYKPRFHGGCGQSVSLMASWWGLEFESIS